jgi:cytidylate kinase
MLNFSSNRPEDEIIQVAIDGPSGAGKSTVARKLSEKLNILFLDTGAMYRAFTLFAKSRNVSDDTSADVVSELFFAFDLQFREGKIFLNGEDVTDAIRTPEIDGSVSLVSSNPFVRERMVELQRKIAMGRSVVMEGRDIGTVVLANTPYKFYLDAPVDVRAQRRYEQNVDKGIAGSREDVLSALEMRDEIDSLRKASPAVAAANAIKIDTSLGDADFIVDAIVAIIFGV